MKAILVRYLPATNFRPSRWKATAEGGHSVTMEYDHGGNADDNAANVAAALCRKMNWTGELIGGGLPDGGRVFVFAKSHWRVTV